MADNQGVLSFDRRFLERHAGSIISDPSVAIVELVANAWDAYATEVDISWPNRDGSQKFSIRDNGIGMTINEFEQRWGKLDYNRLSTQGEYISPPDSKKMLSRRRVYGRNGRGRHGGFAFSDPYEISIESEGEKATYHVSRAGDRPFNWTRINHSKSKHTGVSISAIGQSRIKMTASTAREILSTRFLSDPNFKVSINGVVVTFDDVPENFLRKFSFEIEKIGNVQVIILDTQKPDKTSRQHGIAWRVDRRLVGECGWRGSDYDRVLDGRSSEAKRFTFIVFADFLASAGAVNADWSGFDPKNEVWQQTEQAVQERIRKEIHNLAEERREETKVAVKKRFASRMGRVAPISRDRWNIFVEQLIDTCPSLSSEHIEQISEILANLELSSSRYGLIEKLHLLQAGELDQLNEILESWSITTAKIALDEIQNRLKIIKELSEKLRDESADEVQELQPLMERSLWIFGPEFESMEYTSNRGMSEVIKKIFKSKARGSLNRPDFVILPDSSVGFYSRPSYNSENEASGIGHLIIVELKRPGIPIGMYQKNQAWQYVTELSQRGLLEEESRVTCFVLGSLLAPRERERKEGNVLILPMTYETFLKRAETRMLNLYSVLSEAPFLRDHGLIAEDFVAEPIVEQSELVV